MTQTAAARSRSLRRTVWETGGLYLGHTWGHGRWAVSPKLLSVLRPSRSPRTRVAAATARAATAGLRRLGRSATVGAGHVFLRLAPNGLPELVPAGGCVVVSGTNGKTTTTALLAAALGTSTTVTTNLGGANLRTGVAAALVAAEHDGVAVLEVDEGALPEILSKLKPDVAVILNLSRDQLDRYSEVRHTVERWRAALRTTPDTHVVANGDDPLIAWVADAAGSVTWVAGGCAWLEDTSTCPRCSLPLDHRGDRWSCSCGFATPEELTAMDASSSRVTVALPGVFNQRNAAMAVAAAARFGVDPDAAREAIASVSQVSGRYALIDVDGSPARLLLAKNPAGWIEVLNLLDEDKSKPVALLISAEIADGRDPSWLWDVPFERLRSRQVAVGGPRALDLAVRLTYAEVEHEVVTGSELAAIAAAGAMSPGAAIDVAATYSVFASLARRVA